MPIDGPVSKPVVFPIAAARHRRDGSGPDSPGPRLSELDRWTRLEKIVAVRAAIDKGVGNHRSEVELGPRLDAMIEAELHELLDDGDPTPQVCAELQALFDATSRRGQEPASQKAGTPNRLRQVASMIEPWAMRVNLLIQTGEGVGAMVLAGLRFFTG